MDALAGGPTMGRRLGAGVAGRADVDSIAALYDENAVLYSHPFRDRQRPVDYVSWAFGEQASAVCRFGEPVAAGDRAAVDWWAVITDEDGSEQTVAGTSLLRFRDDGLVSSNGMRGPTRRAAASCRTGRPDAPGSPRLGAAARRHCSGLRGGAPLLPRHARAPRTACLLAPEGRVTILEAGRATLELTDPPHAAYIDEVEVGRRVAGHIRVAFEVEDSESATAALAAAGATVIATPTRTPWNSLNARLEGPAGLQLTLFTELGD